jgi:hypothetical protein
VVRGGKGATRSENCKRGMFGLRRSVVLDEEEEEEEALLDIDISCGLIRSISENGADEGGL